MSLERVQWLRRRFKKKNRKDVISKFSKEH